MATFANDYSQFPEANQPLGPGANENTYGIVIHRVPQHGDYAKVFLTPEEVQKLVANNGEFYIFVKGPFGEPGFYPLSVLIDSPFISAEQQAQELVNDIEKVNDRLRALSSLERVNDEINFVKASLLATAFGDDIFQDCPYLIKRMRENSKMD